MIEFVRHSRKMIAVNKDGEFAGWLSQESRTQATGLHRLRHTWWEGSVLGHAVKQETLTKAKEAVRAALGDAPAA